MKVLLINPPYQTVTSNFGVGHQVPLGLLLVGGPLLDAGHTVELLDAECRRLSLPAIIRAVQHFGPDIVMTGHAGSTPAHPVCLRLLRAIKAACPDIVTIYGGVYPTYHAARILAEEPAVDFIVRGEGEATAVELVETLAVRVRRSASGISGWGADLRQVRSIGLRVDGEAVLTPLRPTIADLDAYRAGWELIGDWDEYHCFGLGRAAIVQFSRGCPHQCTYCGQHGFWVKWRHRDPVKLVDEIAWLYHTHQVRFLTLADENPTTLPSQWYRFLEELAARRLPVSLFATIRATDIVRDAAVLPLYRKAGILYVLMGVESTNDKVLQQIKKGSTSQDDVRACRLLNQHGIFSILGQIVGFAEETWGTFRTARRQLNYYEGSYLNVMYVTPHAWTPFGAEVRDRPVVEPKQEKWDYRHQVLGQKYLRPWQLFAAVKWLELCYHLRPGRLWAILREPNRLRRRQWFWTYLHIGRVWLAEVVEFLAAARWARHSGTVRQLERGTLPSPPADVEPTPRAPAKLTPARRTANAIRTFAASSRHRHSVSRR